ncbi:MAG: hypothetical protein JRN08_03535 [Nitrososphaerota archaeon]|nr:hypothetical protein [Nitrososphaerota archaeon]
METQNPPRPWYKRLRYIIPIGLLVVLLVAALVPVPPGPPETRDQVALNRTIAYFADNYNVTTGLIPETPGSHAYWLYSDNYLATLAVARYSADNQSTGGFASALEAALGGYLATLPAPLGQNQYQALNSTRGYFDCSAAYTVSWSTGGSSAPGNGSAIVRTTANDQSPACAGQNYADLLFLQAVYYHRAGSVSQGLALYRQGAADFDGAGMRDVPFGEAASGSYGQYQTYKLALYLYAGTCLGQQSSDPNYPKLLPILLHQQDNSTGGFDTFYTGLANARNPGAGANTETTALAALALELVISPSGTC